MNGTKSGTHTKNPSVSSLPLILDVEDFKVKTIFSISHFTMLSSEVIQAISIYHLR